MKVGTSHGTYTVQSGATSAPKKSKGPNAEPSSPYDSNLSLYTVPPTGNVTPDEFELLAQDRLIFLKWLEASMAKGAGEWQTKWVDKCPFPLPNINLRLNNPEEAREMVRKDVISHFILKLAYRSPERQDWLITMEAELLRLRMAHYLDGFKELLSYFRFKEAVEVPRYVVQYYQTAKAQSFEQFFEVDWEEVLDLVATKSVCVVGGKAILTAKHQNSVILNKFKQGMKASLELANRTFGTASASSTGTWDVMVKDFLDRLPAQYLGKEATSEKYGSTPVELHQLDELARDHFPLCMQASHAHVRRQHHMPHLGRLQYGLFLKGIGLTLEQSMQFWHDEFIQRAGEEGWKKKQYAYNIQYNYGQVGRRRESTPYSCTKVVGLNASRGEPHGCPFRSYSSEELSQHIAAVTSDGRVKRQILDLVTDHAYTEACITYYRAKRGTASGERLEAHSLHPNLYYIQSRTDADRSAQGEDLFAGPPPSAPDPLNSSFSNPFAANASAHSRMELDASSSYMDEIMDDLDFDPDAIATQTRLNRSLTANQNGDNSSQPAEPSSSQSTSQQLLDSLMPRSEE
jgi:DNA primase large subunit